MTQRSIARISKSLVVYALLVVPPLAGLLGILQLGQSLKPPRSIGGEWQLDGSGGASGCPGIATGNSPAVLRVSQSGPRAEATFSDDARTSLSLVLQGDVLSGDGHSRGAGPCQELALDARLTREPSGDALVGVLRRPGCSACEEIPFRAARAKRK